MVKYRKNASRDTLYALAVENGIQVAEDADRETIIATIEAANTAADTADSAPEGDGPAEAPQDAQESATDASAAAEVSEDPPDPESATDAPESATEGGDGEPAAAADTADNAPEDDGPAEAPQNAQESATDASAAAEVSEDPTDPESATDAPESEESGLFVYIGPSLPRGRLKENAVFNGTLADVKEYLSDVLEDYPQVARLIVPAEKLAAASVKVKTPGNISHKYYNDIESAMRRHKEV